jgi:hypothetical protein
MVVQSFKFKAALEGIASLTREQGAEWKFKAICNHCKSDMECQFSSGEQHEIPSSRGTAHLIQRCKSCKRIVSLNILEETQPYSESEAFATLATFEPRGLQLTTWIPSSNPVFNLVSESGLVFNASLSEDCYEYDEIAEEQVSVTDIQHRID